MSTTKRKTERGYVEPETPQGTEGVVVTPTFTDIVTSGGAPASPARVGNRQYANNTGSEVVPAGGEGTVVESGGGTTASPTPMTYEEWYNRTHNKINQDAQTAKDLANIGYEKSKSEYGSRAAALESMGLTGSGYSDYLTGQAYAQKQSAIAAADAQKAEAMFDLDTKYMDYLEQQKRDEEQRQDTINSNFVTAMGSITADTTDTEIEQMAALGFSEEQIQSLKTQRNTLKTKADTDKMERDNENKQLKYADFLNMIKYDTPDEFINEMAASLGLDDTYITNAIGYRDALAAQNTTKTTKEETEFKDKTYAGFLETITYETSDAFIESMAKALGLESYIPQLKQARLDRIKEYLATLDPDDIDKATLDRYFPNGANDANYGSIYTEYLDKVKANTGGTVDFFVDGKLIPANEAQGALAAIKDVADPEVYAELEKEYNNLYTPVTIGAKLGTNIGGRLRVDNKGDNFEVKYTDSEGTEHTYNVQNGGKVDKDDDDGAVLSFITNGKIGDGVVFKWNGALYLRVGSNIIRVERRATNAHRLTGGQGYDSLFERF